MRAPISIIFEFLETSRPGLQKNPWDFSGLEAPKAPKNQHRDRGYRRTRFLKNSGNPGYASSDLEGLEWCKPEKTQRLLFDPHLEVSKNPKIIEIDARTSKNHLIEYHLLLKKS